MANLATTDNNNAMQANNDFNIPNGYICTLDIETIEGKIALANAINGATSMRDKVGDILPVKDIVTTKGIRSRTSEECTNTYLICDDDNVYFTQSDGIARAVEVIVACFTDKKTLQFTSPVDLGVGLQVKETVMASGNTLKTVVPVMLPTE